VDVECLAHLVGEHPWVLTVEDHTAVGGFGSAVLEAAEGAGLDARKIHRLAAPDAFIEQDSREAQLADIGLSAAGIAARARAITAKS
jgi:1-deoxy-D-xylulose-5-phosphate synthase